jgi:predicted XRE-type DNA-binding protein
VRIQAIEANNRKKAFELRTARGAFTYPYAKLALPPTSENRVAEVYADPETGREAFTYRLESGAEDTVHLDAVLEYHQDPAYWNEVLLHRLTVEVRKALEQSDLAKREVIRRLGTSPSQLYRLLDPSHSSKSAGQLLAILHLLGREVEVVVRPTDPRHAAPAVRRKRREKSTV